MCFDRDDSFVADRLRHQVELEGVYGVRFGIRACLHHAHLHAHVLLPAFAGQSLVVKVEQALGVRRGIGKSASVAADTVLEKLIPGGGADIDTAAGHHHVHARHGAELQLRDFHTHVRVRHGHG